MIKQMLSVGTVSLVLLCTQASAATYTVTNANDSGPGSLRQAILDSNSTAGGDTVNIAVVGTITLTSGRLTINDSLTINGPGASSLTISGNDISRVFEISSGSTVAINNLSVANGFTAYGSGGGIWNSGSLTISNSAITDNFSFSGGAGIENSRGATLTIVNSTISDNAVGPGGEGAGINVHGDLWLVNSTVSGNRADTDYAFGGGFACFSPASVTVQNSTISNNTAADEYTGGAGIFSSGCHITLANSIVAGNTVNGVLARDCHISPDDQTSLGHNLLGEDPRVVSFCLADGPGDRSLALGEVFTTVLGPLQNNGGPTQTHALLPGSPAIDMGNNALIPSGTTADQRGFARVINGAVDSGAVEFDNPVSVTVDIKPHSTRNKIDLDSDIHIWVAVMSDTAMAFDPLQIDVDSVRFGPNGATRVTHHFKDFNGDGLDDLILRFDTTATGIGCFDSSVWLSGTTYAGESFSGTDFVVPRSDNCGDRGEVSIDIRPHSPVNRVFPDSEGILYVAVLSDAVDLFEPDKLDVPTIRFGPGDAEPVGAHPKDFNGDGIDDLILHFNNLATGIECGDTQASLSGRTLNGQQISGTDYVSTRGCPDQIPPVITLTGNDPQVMVVGETYAELGATATDDVDGDLTASIIIDASNVDMLTPGNYLVTYNVTDAAGNAAITLSRTVTVLLQALPLPAEATVSVEGSTKTLSFSWSESEYADYYRLLENADGHSGFTQVGDNIPAGTLTTTRNIAVHMFDWINAQYILEACNTTGCSSSDTVTATDVMLDAIGYFKASNTHRYDRFGYSVSISNDGHIMAVGAPWEDSNAAGVGGNQTSLTRKKSGAVYVFEFDGSNWTQRAYIKASNPDIEDHFGDEVALSGDGRTLVVGVPEEQSNASGINGNQADNSIHRAGAVYLFRDDGTEWYQEAYVKAYNPVMHDAFGASVALSFDGNTLAVGAHRTGVSLLEFNGLTWIRQAGFRGSTDDQYGEDVALSADGKVLAIGAFQEDSNATGIDGNAFDNSATNSGAVVLLRRENQNSWSQWAYIKASNTEAWDYFGSEVALSADGHTLVVSAPGEDSGATGIDGNQFDNSEQDAGAMYVFRSDGTLWYQEAYIKASNPGYRDWFGGNLALSADGNTLAVGAHSERSSAIGVNGDQYDDSGINNGAVYLFRFDDMNWYQQAYVKAPNTYLRDFFSEGIGLSEHGDTLAIGAFREDSNATGVGGNLTDDSATDAGAVYVY